MSDQYAVHCAWCGAEVGYSSVEGSHGICPRCFEQLLGIPLLSEPQLSTLPFGLIELNATGTVLRYNAAEQALSGREASRVIGRNFFTEVAPCTAVSDFQGRFAEFTQSDGAPVSFAFTFPFQRGPIDVHVAFVRSARGTAFVLTRADDHRTH